MSIPPRPEERIVWEDGTLRIHEHASRIQSARCREGPNLELVVEAHVRPPGFLQTTSIRRQTARCEKKGRSDSEMVRSEFELGYQEHRAQEEASETIEF